MTHHLGYEFAADVPEAKSGKPGATLLQDRPAICWYHSDQIYEAMVNDLSDHTDCCGSECKLFHLGAYFFNSPRLILVDSCSNSCHAWTFLLSLSMGHCTLVD